MPAPLGNSNAKDNDGGRPTKYKSEYTSFAQKCCELGSTDVDLADALNVGVTTINQWKLSHPEFCEALKSGKAVADDRVERALYHKAVGYTFDTVKIFQYEGQPVIVPYREHVPPDTTACIFWLKNRRRDQWRDKQDMEHSGTVTLETLVLGSMKKELET